MYYEINHFKVTSLFKINLNETDVTSAPDFLVQSEAVVRVRDDYTSAASFQHLLQSNKRIEIMPYKYKCIM